MNIKWSQYSSFNTSNQVVIAVLNCLLLLSYEKSDTHRFEVPRMLFDEPQALEAYIMKNKDKYVHICEHYLCFSRCILVYTV